MPPALVPSNQASQVFRPPETPRMQLTKVGGQWKTGPNPDELPAETGRAGRRPASRVAFVRLSDAPEPHCIRRVGAGQVAGQRGKSSGMLSSGIDFRPIDQYAHAMESCRFVSRPAGIVRGGMGAA